MPLASQVIPNDVVVTGSFYAAGGMTLPSSSVSNATVAAGAAISADKTYQRFHVKHQQSSTVAAATEYVYIARTSATLETIKAMIAVVATGADRTITIDCQKSTGGGAFATVLSGTIGFTNVSVALTPSSGTFSSTSVAAGDIIKITVAVAGSASAQASGLLVDLTINESPT